MTRGMSATDPGTGQGEHNRPAARCWARSARDRLRHTRIFILESVDKTGPGAIGIKVLI